MEKNKTEVPQVGSAEKCLGEPSPEEIRIAEDKERANRKWDKDKAKYHLILPEFLDLIAVILTRGEENHPKEPNGQPSWQLVEPDAYVSAVYRHLRDYRIDPTSLDKDMGTHHMGHVAANAMFLWWLSLNKE